MRKDERAYVFVGDLCGHSLNMHLGALSNTNVGHVLNGEGIIFASFIPELLRSLESLEPE